MEVAEDLRRLKDSRSRLKSQVNKTTSQILRAIQCNKSVDSLVDSLTEIYADFLEVHENYCDILSHTTNGSLDSYKTVNGQNMEDYFDNVKLSYDSTMQSVSTYEAALNKAKASAVEHEGRALLSQKEFFIEKLDMLPINNEPARDIVFAEIDSVISKLRDFVGIIRGINVGDYSIFYSDVSACIISLEQSILLAKQKPHVVTSPQSVPIVGANQGTDTNSQSNPVPQTSDTSSSPNALPQNETPADHNQSDNDPEVSDSLSQPSQRDMMATASAQGRHVLVSSESTGISVENQGEFTRVNARSTPVQLTQSTWSSVGTRMSQQNQISLINEVGLAESNAGQVIRLGQPSHNHISGNASSITAAYKYDTRPMSSTSVLQYSGTGVPQYSGTSVPQYSGTSVPQYSGTSVPQYSGTGVPQYFGTGVPQYSGASVPQYSGTGVPQYSGTSVPQYSGTSVPQYSGTGVPQYSGTSVPQYSGTSVPQYSGTSVPRCSGTGVPQYSGTGVPQYSGTSVPQCSGTGVPQYSGASVPQYSAGTGVPQHSSTGVLFQHSGTSVPQQDSYKRESRFKRPSLPTFNGNRKEWPEFRAVWSAYALTELRTEEERAWGLKQCLQSKALDHVKAILASQPNAYERMWKRLDDIYSDATVTVKTAFESLNSLKPIKEGSVRGLISLINDVEMAYCQLGEVKQLSSVSLAQVDMLRDLLPPIIKREWMRLYRSLPRENQIHPFPDFMRFLEQERDICIRESESEPIKEYEKDGKRKERDPLFRTHVGNTDTVPQQGKSNCLVHSHPSTRHGTMQCFSFKKMDHKERTSLLNKHKACYKCAGNHRNYKCDKDVVCSICKQTSHHTLICRNDTPRTEQPENSPNPNQESANEQIVTSTNHSREKAASTLFAIHTVPIIDSDQLATIFYDNGSNISYVTHTSAKRLKAVRLGKSILRVKGIGNHEAEYDTCTYRVKLMATDGSTITIIAHGLEQITSKVSPLDMIVLQGLFPQWSSITELMRQPGSVDILLGAEYYGFHPKTEVDRAGTHLSIMEGTFGRCLVGSHPSLKEGTSYATSISGATIEAFIKGEEMVTEIIPQCGACKCGKCPIPGHTYSFQEEQELNIIRSNLCYDQELKLWSTKYPWSNDPAMLPDNYQQCLATLRSTERALKRRGEEWCTVYNQQIIDMVERGAARKLSDDEITAWTGPVYYISHLAVESPKSSSTPVRIVFNSSQKCKGVSLNDFLVKGPDNYINSLLGMLLRWRENGAVMVGDIKKMFHSITTDKSTQHCHRFLWRNLDEQKSPETYVITRVNMGDRPAPAICAEAIRQTADMVASAHPRVTQLLRESIYVDDIVDSISSLVDAKKLAKETDEVLSEFGFKIKCWQFSGEKPSNTAKQNALKVQDQSVLVLGLKWDPENDQLSFEPNINFAKKIRGRHCAPPLQPQEVPTMIPLSMTKRQVLEQVMRLYDPLGILSPFVMLGKLYLRETWEIGAKWDDPLPAQMVRKWTHYFCEMMKLVGVQYDRCLTPQEAVGLPTLVIFSDASEKAYGFAAYIRWKLSDGKYWSNLIMAKSRIAPLKRLSTPQLELNGAVLAKRAKVLIEKEMRFTFSNVVNLIDSETVLHMLHKESTRFKLYEGVRVGEIQSSYNENLSAWCWVPGEHNTADWVSRGRYPNELTPDSEWITGPDFLREPESMWPIKTHSELEEKGELLPGEKKLVDTHTSVVAPHATLIQWERFSNVNQLLWVVARLKAIGRMKTFKGGATCNVTVQDIKSAQRYLVTEAQLTMVDDLQDLNKGKYKALKPIQDSNSIWVIGGRMASSNPMANNMDNQLPILLPTVHSYTRLLMRQCHEKSGHRGRDATLARFRAKFWTPHGSKVAKSAVSNCQLCKVRKPTLGTQQMGPMPSERLTPSLPFSNVMIDFFGPYLIRGEVQKRISGKVYGIIFTDMVSRAVHVEPCHGYDTHSFLLALRRFTSIRGWPKTIYSDPGSQLVNADKEIQDMWKHLDKETLYKSSTDKGTQWVFGPADSPWYQGAAEALIKGIKQCFNFAIGSQRLSGSEFHTVCYEAANILNERPLGRIPGSDSEITILTPNSLLLGRSSASVLDSSKLDIETCKSRFGLVNLVTEKFWEKWCQLYAPMMVRFSKWTKESRNFKVGDVVVVSDSNQLRSQYILAEIIEANPDKDGRVRRVQLRYKNHKVGKHAREYAAGGDVIVTRSIQRIALLVAVDTEQ